MESLRAHLRSSTAEAHQELEDTEFSRALRQRQLQRVSALTYLHCLAVVHAALERRLSHSADPRVRQVWQPEQARLPLLLEDLGMLGSEREATIRPAVLAGLQLAQGIVRSDSEVALLGFLYVLEGSQNGGVLLKGLFADALGVAADRLRYLGCHGKDTRSAWDRFCAALDSVRLDAKEREFVLAAALELFGGLKRLAEALHPHDPSNLRHHVSSMNPDAGDHPIPQDPREIEAALRAGVRARERFPYLDSRYGERGRRFTTSDSCWLMTLVPQPEDSVRRSILWLRGVLSTRGLPTWILETHMRELAAERPAEGFRKVIDELASERSRHVPVARVSELIRVYEPRLSAIRDDRGPVVELLAAALADERAGVTGAFEATRSWYLGAGSAGAEWDKIIGELVRELST